MDILIGTNNDDFLEIPGESYRDTLVIGKGGNDFLMGTYGQNLLFAGPGDDSLLGLEGNDFLSGGSGDDYLAGGLDNDLLLGGRGADEFEFYSNTGSDVILDFNIAEDTLTINSGAEFIITEENGSALIDFGGEYFEGQVTLVGVDPSLLEGYFA